MKEPECSMFPNQSIPTETRMVGLSSIQHALKQATEVLAYQARSGDYHRYKDTKFPPMLIMQWAVERLTQAYFLPEWTWDDEWQVRTDTDFIREKWIRMLFPIDEDVYDLVERVSWTELDYETERACIRDRLEQWKRKLYPEQEVIYG